MKLVEVICSARTDDETVARTFDHVQGLSKIPVVVNDARGIYTSRTFGTFVLKGTTMSIEGVAAPVIENAGIQCGMALGPLATIDETALSLSVDVREQTRADCAERGKPYVEPGSATLDPMVKELKRLGRASGGGFYDYPAGKGAKKTQWPELKPLFEKPGRLWYCHAIETAWSG